MALEPSPSASRRGLKDTPFYKVPEHLKDKLSSQIISDAKNSLKSVATHRPETPRDGKRNLFGEQSARDPTNRPASAISIDSRYLESESRPVSGTRLAPLDFHRHSIREQDVDAALAPKPPPDPTRPPRPPSGRTRPLLHQSVSVDTAVEGKATKARTVEATNSVAVKEPAVKERRVHSGPKERSKEEKRSEKSSKRRSVPCADDRVESGYASSDTREGSASSQRGSGGGGTDAREGSASSQRGSSASAPAREGSAPKGSSEARGGSGGGQRKAKREGSTGRTAGKRSGSASKPSSGGRREAAAAAVVVDKPELETTKLISGGDSSVRGDGGGRGCEVRAGATYTIPEHKACKNCWHSKGSGGRREEETADEAQYYNMHVAPILDQMTTQVKDTDPERLLGLSDMLHQVLEEGNLLGKACKRRPAMLKTVFKLLDLDTPRLLLKLARLILALRVSGNNLTNVCKLVFKVSRDEKNDNFFLTDNLLDLLIETVHTAEHSTNAEALVYCVGSLKFLSGNNTVVKHLVQRRVIEAMARLLIAINNNNEAIDKPNEQLGHILVQLTATLRNVADVSSTRSQFLSHGVVDELGRTMQQCAHDKDLMLNIARILSKITVHTDCCNAVGNQPTQLKAMLDLLAKYKDREDLVVRLCFVLGNVTAKNDGARDRLAAQSNALETLLTLLKYYLEQDIKLCNQSLSSGEERTGPSKQEDVVMKVVRVIANLSIRQEVGQDIAASLPCVEYLISILNVKKLSHSEELVMNVLATVNNLSYYNCRNSAITKRQIQLADALLPLFDHNTPHDGLAEATRVFGNLSREKSVRDHLAKHKVDEVLISLLDSDHRELVFTACGVLINLMADEEKRPVLKRCSGITKLVEVLRDFARQDWQLASMVCQTLWNYSGKITSTNNCFGTKEAADLSELLTEYLDEDCALDPTLTPDYDPELQDYYRDVWQGDFCPVASQLADRIEAKQSKFVPLDNPT